jgi:hypothetical protein
MAAKTLERWCRNGFRVAKLVSEEFGRQLENAESLDDFRYKVSAIGPPPVTQQLTVKV